MVDLNNYIKSLKVSWVNKYLLKNNNWNMFLDINLTSDICNTGTHNLIHPKHINPFWKNVLDAWSEFSQKLSLLLFLIL
jgi:hypothetical protein